MEMRLKYSLSMYMVVYRPGIRGRSLFLQGDLEKQRKELQLKVF